MVFGHFLIIYYNLLYSTLNQLFQNFRTNRTFPEHVYNTSTATLTEHNHPFKLLNELGEHPVYSVCIIFHIAIVQLGWLAGVDKVIHIRGIDRYKSLLCLCRLVFEYMCTCTIPYIISVQ